MKAHDGYTGPTICNFSDRHGRWRIASSVEVAEAECSEALWPMPDGASTFYDVDDRQGIYWRRARSGVALVGSLHSVGEHRFTEAEAVRLVAAGGPRVR